MDCVIHIVLLLIHLVDDCMKCPSPCTYVWFSNSKTCRPIHFQLSVLLSQMVLVILAA